MFKVGRESWLIMGWAAPAWRGDALTSPRQKVSGRIQACPVAYVTMEDGYFLGHVFMDFTLDDRRISQ